MMPLNVTVVATDQSTELAWVSELQQSLLLLPQITVEAHSLCHNYGHVVFLDGLLPDLEPILRRVPRSERALFLILPDGSPAPQALMDGKVDNVLLHPFRSLEVLGKLHHYQQILLWDEVSQLNVSFSGLIENLYDDLRLAERLQKAKTPGRFPDLKGFKVVSRYLAGAKPGGDFFDLAESKDGSQVSILMSDSSSYGLSSAVLSVLMRVAAKLSIEESRSCKETFKRIYDEILHTLSPKDQLSIFYGIVSRKTNQLRYVHCGSACVFHARAGGEYVQVPPQKGPITHQSDCGDFPEAHLQLEPSDRMVFLSDGFVEGVGGAAQSHACLEKFRNKENLDTLNEFSFQIKSKLAEADDLPVQDCTAVILDVDSRVVKLAAKSNLS